MSLPPNYAMRFIATPEQLGFNTFWVRIGHGDAKYKAHKAFAIRDYKGRREAKKAAKEYRDKHQKIYEKITGIHLGTNKHYWGECVCINGKWSNGTYYKYVIASYYDRKKKKQINRAWSINKYGIRLAKKLAYQWRDLKRTGKLD